MGSKKENLEKEKNKPKKEEGDTRGAQDSSKHGGKIITDSRFASVHSDPRFQKFTKHKAKVAIDSRFDRMFSDKSFTSSSARLDKRGKPTKIKKENPLRHYYKLDEDEEGKEKNEEFKDVDEDGEEEEEREKQGLKKLGRVSLDSELSDESERSRSEDELESDGSQSTTDTDEEDDEEYLEEDEPVEENIPVIEKETHRLAVVNMDWSQVKAVDLYVVLSSFLPKGGQILSVAVYPSEFGLKRMEEEAVHGPIGLFDDDKEGEDDEDGNDEIDEEKLRAYEMSRLRYYYAVVDCDSSATADYLYKACDGVEFERSSNKLDLRFIPDSMEFKPPPRDVAKEAPTNYDGLDFHTRVLQHSNIHLSWDEDEPHRVKTLKRKFNADQLAELELNEFLASDGSETDDDKNGDGTEDQSDKKHNKRDMYRALIQSGDGSDEEGEDDGQDMEVTFNTGLEDISKRILEKKDKKSETVWEAYLRKRSEKKKARKNRSKHSSEDESSDTDQEATEQPDDFFVEEPSVKRNKEARGKSRKKEKQLEEMDRGAEASRAELELLLADYNGADTSLKGYNMKHKKAKGRKGKEVPDEDKIPTINYDDPRFSAVFTSPLFALDPTDPQFRRSATYARQLAQKQQKGNPEDLGVKEHAKLSTKAQLASGDPEMSKNEHSKSDVLPSKKEKHELSSLVKSIKMKSKQLQLPTNDRMSKEDKRLQPRDMAVKDGKHELTNLVESIKKKAKLRQK